MMPKPSDYILCFLLLQVEATTGSQATKLEYYTVKQLVVGEEDNKSIADSYVWVTGEFSDCSVTCGIGKS